MIHIKNGYAFFWSEWPSNWRISPMTIDGTLYNCVEQWMMAEKCRCFGDTKHETMVMAAPDPFDQKRFGRMAGPYVESKWAAVRYDIVLRGTLEKYRQNPDLRRMLFDSQYDGVTFVEASPEDTVWGIGLKKDDPRAWDEATWLGTNLLGKAVTEARAILQPVVEGVGSGRYNSGHVALGDHSLAYDQAVQEGKRIWEEEQGRFQKLLEANALVKPPIEFRPVNEFSAEVFQRGEHRGFIVWGPSGKGWVPPEGTPLSFDPGLGQAILDELETKP